METRNKQELRMIECTSTSRPRPQGSDPKGGSGVWRFWSLAFGACFGFQISLFGLSVPGQQLPLRALCDSVVLPLWPWCALCPLWFPRGASRSRGCGEGRIRSATPSALFRLRPLPSRLRCGPWGARVIATGGRHRRSRRGEVRFKGVARADGSDWGRFCAEIVRDRTPAGQDFLPQPAVVACNALAIGLRRV